MTRNQEIRKEILLQLYAARPLAHSPALIARQGKKAGLDYSENEIAAECAFLAGQGLIGDVEDTASGELKFAITSKGVLEYERNN